MHDQYIEGVIFGIPSFPNSIQFIQNLPSWVGEDQSEVESKKWKKMRDRERQFYLLGIWTFVSRERNPMSKKKKRQKGFSFVVYIVSILSDRV